MTNWVTIKIPEETRDKAKEDSRTYEQIMKAGLNSDEQSVETNAEMPEVDTEGIAAAIVDEMEASKGVTIEQVEISEGQSMDRDDVENIVESWVERNLDRLKRGTL